MTSKNPCPNCGGPKAYNARRCHKCALAEGWQVGGKLRTNNWEERKQHVKEQLEAELAGRREEIPQPITCQLCGIPYADNRAYTLHLEPRPGKEPFHSRPEHIEQLHWNSAAWEIIPMNPNYTESVSGKKFNPMKTPPGHV